MGISGLLPVLKSITESKTIDQYAGQTIAIDGYCWLHRAIYSCSQEICLGQETDKYISYFMERLETLIEHKVTPYVVFDGDYLPMKKKTEEERHEQRTKYKELGKKYLAEKKFFEARKCFIRGAEVTPFMAYRIIQRLIKKKISYIVAPYEADAQLAFLVKNKIVDAVISEDSDCLVFGCQRVLFKLDRDGKNFVQEIDLYTNFKSNQELKFHLFDHQMFLEMCILSGCDYLNSLPGFGLKRAYHFMKQYGNYQKVIQALQMEAKIKIPINYVQNFQKAIQTFKHQRVFDPISQEIVFLTPFSSFDQENLINEKDTTEMDFLGPFISKQDAIEIAQGRMDPISRTYFSTSMSNIAASASDSDSTTLTIVEETKKSICRFFLNTTTQKKTPEKKTISSQEEEMKNCATPPVVVLSTTSQRQSMNVSLSPVDQELKQQQQLEQNTQIPKKQDAFSRMMQAGGSFFLQKQQQKQQKQQQKNKQTTIITTAAVKRKRSFSSKVFLYQNQKQKTKNTSTTIKAINPTQEIPVVNNTKFSKSPEKENVLPLVSSVHTNVPIGINSRSNLRNSMSTAAIHVQRIHSDVNTASDTSSMKTSNTSTTANLFTRFKYQKKIDQVTTG